MRYSSHIKVSHFNRTQEVIWDKLEESKFKSHNFKAKLPKSHFDTSESLKRKHRLYNFEARLHDPG